MKMTAKFEAEGESFNACFEQLNSAFNAEFSASGGGQDGKDGATFTPSVSEDGVISWTNDRELPNPAPVNIKGAKGDKGADGADGITPVKGIDYFTEQDVQEIAERAAEMVDVPEGGVTSWNDLTDKPDFAPVATSGSWNDLTDKPFGEYVPEPITWSGNLEDYEPTVFGPKISERGLTKDELIGSTLRFYNMDLTEERSGVIGPDALSDFSQNNPDLPPDTLLTVSNVSCFISVAADITLQGVTVSKGFYVLSERFISLTFPQTIKTLDEKYLPDSVVLENELEAKGYQTEAQVTALINEAISNLPRYNGEVEEI